MSLQHTFGELRSQLAKRIIGQAKLVDRLLIALLADGHLLVVGAPGLAKTTAIKALADPLAGSDERRVGEASRDGVTEGRTVKRNACHKAVDTSGS